MEVLEYLVVQMVQPYFYYALAFSIAAFLAVNLVLRCTTFCSHGARSLLHILPLLVPGIVYLLYPPSLTILTFGGRAMPAMIPPEFGTYLLPGGRPGIYPGSFSPAAWGN